MGRRNRRCWSTAGTCISLMTWKHSWAFCTFVKTVWTNEQMCARPHLDDASVFSPAVGPSWGGTPRRWGSCGWVCCASTRRSLTLESTWCVSASTPASPLSTSSGRLNTSSLKVSRRPDAAACLCRLVSFRLTSVVLCIIPDPFDLNHNLGAGLSRKSTVIRAFLWVDSTYFSCFPVYFISHLLPSVTNFIMKAFINGRRVFGTPHKAFPPIYPSLMVSICLMRWTHETRIKTGLFSICCRSISSTLKFSPRGRWLQMTAAAVSVARSATSWKTAPCAKSRDLLLMWSPKLSPRWS